jgi:predicted ATPase/DNA-binding CsgD family transcriptional regulator
MTDRKSLAEESYADDLTWREQEVLVLLSERLTNREIAERLHLAESTVKDYVGKILSKLYVKNRRQAVEKARALGLLDGDRKATHTPAVKLPAEPTPFIGRRDELAEIRQLLSGTRLLTLTGPGGIGKTRLALRTAVEMACEFDHGSFFVPLAPIHSVDHLIQTIAEGVKFPLATQEDPQHQLLRYLRDKQHLLVMDNFEHLLDGAKIIHEILQAAPEVKILATSRERLNLMSEMVLHVSGMSFPDALTSKDTLDYDAINLFLQSARKVHPGYEPSANELAQIATICQIVEGMPLAIELAAGWLHILSVDEITQELEQGLDILTTEARDAPPRHRSIHAVFNHSWSMLQPAEQEIFMRLSVFRGGFTRQAAHQVAGASLQQLAGFVDKSFLRRDPNTGRLEIHELLRQFVQEQLDKTPGDSLYAHAAHAAYYAAFMQERWVDLKGNRQIMALSEIEADIENVRAAWRTYQDQRNASQMWMFIKGIWYVYWNRWWNHAGMVLFAGAVSALQGQDDEESVTVRTLAMAFQGFFMAWLDMADRGYELAKESVAILGQLDHPESLVLACISLSVNAYMLGRYSVHLKAVNKILKITPELEDKWLVAYGYFAAGMIFLVKEDYPAAKRLAESGLKLTEEIGDVIGSSLHLIVLGHVALDSGEHEKARGFYLRCLKTSEQVGFPFGIQTASKYLGKVDLSIGKIGEAEIYLLQSLTITKEIGFVRDIINLFYEFARLRAAQGDAEGAVKLLALVLQHPSSHQTRSFEGSIRDSAKELLAEIKTELPSETYMTALACGQELELGAVIAELVGSRS